jgi:flavin reductase (DIM6/NTAB) family NADH-FMN oxidoreductase RutF
VREEWVHENIAKHEVADALINSVYRPLWVMTSHRGSELSGSLVTSGIGVFRSNPVKFLVCVSKHDFSHEVIMESGVFAIHSLRPDQIALTAHFAYQSSRDVDKFATLEYTIGHTGCPLLRDCVGAMEFEVVERIDTSYATIVMGEIRNAEARLPLDQITYGTGMNEEWFRKNMPPRPAS